MSEIHESSCLDFDWSGRGPIKCVVTDPPYGVAFTSKRVKTPEQLQYVRPIANDGDLESALALFGDAMDKILPYTAEEAELYVFTRWDIVGHWIDAIKALGEYGFAYKMMLVWVKGDPGLGDIDCNWGCGHELILYAKKGRREMPYRRSGVISVDRVHSTRAIHPTEKPVALIEKLLEMSTNHGDLVVDPFSGSGSTMVAAQNLGRLGHATEVDSTYVKRSRERLLTQTFF